VRQVLIWRTSSAAVAWAHNYRSLYFSRMFFVLIRIEAKRGHVGDLFDRGGGHISVGENEGTDIYCVLTYDKV